MKSEVKRALAIAVGKRIKKVRGGLTQKRFAREIGLDEQIYISRWETGARLPPLEIQIQIAKFGGVSLDWLLTGRERQNQQKQSAA